MQYYAGIDLHASNSYIGIIDDNNKRLFDKRLPNDLGKILMVFEPFKEHLKGIVVESTFNWYWLVDGLQDNDYTAHLANPSAIKQYEGLKHVDDRSDTFWLAEMLKLNILPQGYIYPKEERPLRDLLRRRSLYVKHRTAHILSLQGMIARNNGVRVSGRDIQKMEAEDVSELFDSPHLILAAQNNLEMINSLKGVIKKTEKAVLAEAKLRKEFELLLTIPGIGNILALTIMMEVGDISRFKIVGDYSSYCRCVRSQKLSDGKKKGENNSKNGNKYLSYAYIEGANYMKRYCDRAHRFYQRKTAKRNSIVAIKALSNKMARASYFIMRDQVPFDEESLFRHPTSRQPIK